MKVIFILIIFLSNLLLYAQNISFGAISTVQNSIMQKKLTPLMDYISATIKKDIKFKTGIDYIDTIEKFQKGEYDLGYIGPAPYILATQKNKNALKIIVGLNNKNNGNFHSVIVVRKNSPINSMDDLKNKTFAFGSPKSTLSFFIPMDMLKKQKIEEELKEYVFLDKHDKVAKFVIMGKYDAGGIKESVAKKYSKYLKIIATSQDIPDFLIVANEKFPDELVEKIKKALLQPNLQNVVKSIKPSATGFRERKREDYLKLKEIIDKIESQDF